MKAEDVAHKAVISNLNEQIALMTFSQSFLDEALARTLPGSAQASALQNIYATRAQAKSDIMNSKSIAAPILQSGLKKLETLGPSMMEARLAELTLPPIDSEGILVVQRDLATKTGELKLSMDNFTNAVLAGKIKITRMPDHS